MNTQATNNSSLGPDQGPQPQFQAASPLLMTPLMTYTSSGGQTAGAWPAGTMTMNPQGQSMISVSPAFGQTSAQNLANSGIPIAQWTDGNQSPLQFNNPSPQPQFFFSTPSPAHAYVTTSPAYVTTSPYAYTGYTPQLTAAPSPINGFNLPMSTPTFLPLPLSPQNSFQQQPAQPSQFPFLPEISPPVQEASKMRKRQPETGAETFGMAAPNPLFQEKRRGPGPQPQKGQTQKKYAYRSKQKKIDRVYNHIKDMYMQADKFAAEKELVRGDDTLRIHVKTFDGLSDIVTALNEVEQHRDIETTRLAAVFSKKNKFQKKGFIVYLKLKTEDQRKQAEAIFGAYAQSLKNVAVAKKRDDVTPAVAVEATTEPEKKAECFDAAPPLRKLNSAGYAA